MAAGAPKLQPWGGFRTVRAGVCACRMRIVTAIVVCCFGLTSRALAGGAGGDEGLITETIAGRERVRDYDNRAMYGAEAMDERSRKHVSPDGGRIGNFIVLPSVATRAVYDDNIFGAARDAVGDMRYEIAPSIEIESDLPRHIARLAVGANLVRFSSHEDQNYNDLYASFNGALHIDHAHTLAVKVSSSMFHERPGDLLSPVDAGEPVQVDHHDIALGLTRDAGRLYGTLSVRAQRFDYHDSRLLAGTTIDQDVRDMDLLTTQLKVGYRFSPGYELIGKLRLLRQIHDGVGAADLDATGYDAVVGVAFETNPLLRWRLLGGYGIRDYDAVGANSVTTGLMEAQVEWLPTQRMTIVGAASRQFVDTVGLDTEGRVDTQVSARADLELLNNLVLSFGGQIRDSDFNGSARFDRTYNVNADLQYYLNKNLLLSLGLEHSTRDSTDDAFDLDRNSVMVGVKYRY